MEPIILSDVNSLIQSIHNSELIILIDTSDLHKIASAISALANTNGGTLLIGISDKSKLKGVNPLELDSIQQFLTKNISPIIDSNFSVIQIRHYFIFKVEVDGSSQVHSFLDADHSWKRSVIINKTVVNANEVIEMVLKLKTDVNHLDTISSLCCVNIMNELNSNVGVSLSRLASKSSFKRSEVVCNLAYLILTEKVRIALDDSKLNYFSI